MDQASSHSRRLLLGPLVLLAVLSTEVASAQPRSWPPDHLGWNFYPFFQTSGVYEDNVLFTDPKQGSMFLRLTPGIETYYGGRFRTFRGGYTFDGEVYPEQFASLRDVFARQRAFAELRTQWSPRSRVALSSAFLSTTRPEEVLQETGLIPLRRRARSFVASAEFGRDLSRRLSLSTGYALNFRKFERPDPRIPTAGSVLHALSIGVSYRHSERSTSSLAYRARFLIQDDIAPGLFQANNFTSQVLTYLWSWELSRKAQLSLSVGPRWSEAVAAARDPQGVLAKVRSVQPEIRAALSYVDARRDFSIQYTKSQYQPLGPGGFIDTESLAFPARFSLTPQLHIQMTPAWYRNERAATTSNAAEVYLAAHYRVSEWASLETSYLYHYQRVGSLLVASPEQAFGTATSRNTVLFGLRLSRFDEWN